MIARYEPTKRSARKIIDNQKVNGRLARGATDDIVMAPKITMVKNAMESVDLALQDNIVGLTDELAKENLRFLLNGETDLTVAVYKSTAILVFGFRRPIAGKEEFFIEVANTIKV